MKEKFIYLDWNIVKELKDNPNTQFANVVKTISNKKIFPFSFAHLCDRQKNFSESTAPLISDDLVFLNNLSRGHMLGRDGDDYDISKQNIFEKYVEVAGEKSMEGTHLSEIPNDILNEIKRVGPAEFFKTIDNRVWFQPMCFSAFSRFDSNEEVYSLFRDIYKLSTPKSLDFMYPLQKPKLLSSDLKTIVEKYLKFNGSQDQTTRKRLGTAYMLLDFNPDFQEKVSRKSNFSNIFTDLEHMLNASFSECYVTKDKRATKKTNFVFTTYCIDTPVYSVEEFVEQNPLTKEFPF